MKILVVNDVFHSVMGDSESDPPASQTTNGMIYTSVTVQVTEDLKVFYPGCIWDGAAFSEPATGKLTSAEVNEYWQRPNEIYAVEEGA